MLSSHTNIDLALVDTGGHLYEQHIDQGNVLMAKSAIKQDSLEQWARVDVNSQVYHWLQDIGTARMNKSALVAVIKM